MKTVTVRLPDDLHREVKVRAAQLGDSLEGIARAAYVAYVDGGLGSGEVSRAASAPSQGAAAASPVPSPERPFRPDPKGAKK